MVQVKNRVSGLPAGNRSELQQAAATQGEVFRELLGTNKEVYETSGRLVSSLQRDPFPEMKPIASINAARSLLRYSDERKEAEVQRPPCHNGRGPADRSVPLHVDFSAAQHQRLGKWQQNNAACPRGTGAIR
jgi:hypothetical protein